MFITSRCIFVLTYLDVIYIVTLIISIFAFVLILCMFTAFVDFRYLVSVIKTDTTAVVLVRI